MPSITPYTPVRTDYANVQDDPNVPAITGPELQARDEAITLAIDTLNDLGSASDHAATEFDAAGDAAAAQAAAIAAAATDATTKADAAQAAAQTHADTAVAGIVNSAPSTLDTLKELADALGDDQNYAATTTAALAARMQKSANLSDVASAATALTNIGGASTTAVAQLKGSTVYVEDYGAVGDGTTDDTAHIQNAINAAVAAAVSNGSHSAKVRFQAKTYAVNGSLVQGGTTFGNALIPLPVIGMTAHTVTLTLEGAGEASALPIWTQTVPQRTGTVLLTTVAGTNHATFGEACVLGGPNSKQGFGTTPNTWNNMMVVVDGISISLPSNPQICGFDFGCMAQAIIKSASAFPAGVPGSVVDPTASWQFGMRMPLTDNQSISIVDRFSAEGCNTGILLSEHSIARCLYFIYCEIGISYVSTQWTPHYSLIEYANVEWCQYALEFRGPGTIKVRCIMLDIEPGTGIFAAARYISDPNNYGIGYIGLGDNAHDTPLARGSSKIVGGNRLRLEDFNLPSGAVTAPTMPATATPLVNFWRNAHVMLSGTVTDVKVDGQSLAISGAVANVGIGVPAGKTIEVDYTGTAPTWVWTLLP